MQPSHTLAWHEAPQILAWHGVDISRHTSQLPIEVDMVDKWILIVGGQLMMTYLEREDPFFP
jgi:hypothetical protein